MQLHSWVAVGATNSFILKFDTGEIQLWTPSPITPGIPTVSSLPLSSDQYEALSPNVVTTDPESVESTIRTMVAECRNTLDAIAVELP